MRNFSRTPLLRPLRDRAGRWLHGQIDTVASVRVHRELDAERAHQLRTPRTWGPAGRLHVADGVVLNDALLNTVSGSITVEEHAFFGHGVALLTGTHDIQRFGLERQMAIPSGGRDIVIGRGAWVASRATVLGPCRIGANAVIAAGAVVDADVPPDAIARGNPARLVGRVGSKSATLPPAVRLMTDVGTMFAHANDQVITPYLRAYGRWETTECRLLETELTPGSVAVDVGANIGYMTLAAAHAVGPTGLVIAIEPHPDNLKLLRANLTRNGLAHNVRVIGAAAWDTAGSVGLAECTDNTGDHRVETLHNDRNIVKVDAICLDDVITEDVKVAVIKLDTQATEHHALNGAKALLERDRPVLLTEFWPQGIRDRGEDPSAVLAGFRRLGYELEVPEDPALAALDDDELIEKIHIRPAPFGGFTTLRLSPR